MRFLLPLLAFTLLTASCQRGSIPPPSNVASAPALGQAVSDKDSKISAHAEAAELANQSNQDGPPKQAVAGALSVVRSLAGPARPEDRVFALKLVQDALVGKLAESQAGWAKERDGAAELVRKITALEKQVQDERIAAASEMARKLNEAETKAENERKRWQTAIFAGTGALLVVVGIAFLVLTANPVTAASYAFLGPKAGWAALAAGLTLISIGIAVNAIEKAIDRHPYVFIGAIALSLGLIGIAGVLTYANHAHHVNERTNR